MAGDEKTPQPPPNTVTLRPMPAAQGKAPESRFGERLREARQELGLSIEGLSRLCRAWDEGNGKGLSPPTLGRYEAAETYPVLPDLRLLADALGVPAQWLIDGGVPNQGKNAVIQKLTGALNEFVRMTLEDGRIGEFTLSEIQDQHDQATRAQRLTQARRGG